MFSIEKGKDAMRMILIALVLAGIGIASCRAQDTVNSANSPERSLAAWLDELSDSDETAHEHTRALLANAVGQIGQKKLLDGPIVFIFAIIAEENQRPAASEAQITAWSRELAMLVPRIKSLLKRASEENVSILWQMLVVADPTADFLEDGFSDLLCERSHCSVFYSVLFTTGAAVAPRDKSVLYSTVQLLEKLSDEQRQSLDVHLRESQGGLFGPTTCGIAIFLLRNDRIQAELQSLSKLLSPQHPETLRLMSLAVLSELGVEARPVLPRIKDLLADENESVRQTAAFAIAAITKGAFDVKKVAAQARLQARDIVELTNTASEYVIEAEGMNEYICEQVEPEYIRHLLVADKTNVGKRRFLGFAIQLMRNSEAKLSSLQVVIENMLKMDGLEDETRRLAKVALNELDGLLLPEGM